MVNDNYKQTLENARSELKDLLAQRATLDARIAKLRQAVGGLAQLCGEPVEVEPVSEWTLIDAIREVLRAAPLGAFQTADEIKKGLILIDYDIKGNANILASIQTTLRRMADSNEVKIDVKDDKKAYRLMTFRERQSAIMSGPFTNAQEKLRKSMEYVGLPMPRKPEK